MDFNREYLPKLKFWGTKKATLLLAIWRKPLLKTMTEEQESIRNLIRCRLNLKEDEKNAKLQINSFFIKSILSLAQE